MISDVESIILLKRTICSPLSSPHQLQKEEGHPPCPISFIIFEEETLDFMSAKGT